LQILSKLRAKLKFKKKVKLYSYLLTMLAGSGLGGSIELVMMNPLFKLLIGCVCVDICQCKFDKGEERICPGAVGLIANIFSPEF